MDHPSILSIRLSKMPLSLSALELSSEANLASHLRSSPSAARCRSQLGVVGLGGFEPPTSRLSGVRSNQTEL